MQKSTVNFVLLKAAADISIQNVLMLKVKNTGLYPIKVNEIVIPINQERVIVDADGTFCDIDLKIKRNLTAQQSYQNLYEPQSETFTNSAINGNNSSNSFDADESSSFASSATGGTTTSATNNGLDRLNCEIIYKKLL